MRRSQGRPYGCLRGLVVGALVFDARSAGSNLTFSIFLFFFRIVKHFSQWEKASEIMARVPALSFKYKNSRKTRQ